MCVDLFKQDLRQPVKSELTGSLRAAPDDPLLPFPDGIAAFNDAAQPEKVPQNGTNQSEEPAERVLPLVVPGDKAQQ